jgi:tRNA-specific 2-thiouridylase
VNPENSPAMPPGRGRRIIVGLSGGVDSSVAALRLVELGYDVEGLFMKNWEEDDTGEYCAAAADLADARAVAARLGIRLHSVNFSDEYWERVFSYFLAEYRSGRTPNPDVLCNREIKFRAFLDHALRLGAHRIATGHYARVVERGSVRELHEATDRGKDQTYFLYLLDQHQLAHSLFPLADLTKESVRRIAKDAGFTTHAKKDSTGICFIGERRFRDFLARYLPASAGDIETPDGRVVGQHHGLMFYTIGQRQGIGIGGVANAGEAPWYVAGKDLDRNVLTVVQGHDHPLLFSATLTASRAHWIAGTPPQFPLECRARCRHRQPLQACTVHPDGSSMLRVVFAHAQRAVTPGQSVVFYAADNCLGGAVIAAAGPPGNDTAETRSAQNPTA